jgi:quercetin dioxygenase-like cupin family protein
MYSKQEGSDVERGTAKGMRLTLLAAVAAMLAGVSAYVVLASDADQSAPDDEPAIASEETRDNAVSIPSWGDNLSEAAVDSGGIERDLDGNASALIASDQLLAGLFLSANASADSGDSSANDSHAAHPKVTTLMRQPLRDHPGKEGVLVAVAFAPGHVDEAHRHPGHAFVYVLEGSVEMQMEGGDLYTLTAGDAFYEDPKDTHSVGRNASETEPAKLLVFFVADQNAPLVLPMAH